MLSCVLASKNLPQSAGVSDSAGSPYCCVATACSSTSSAFYGSTVRPTCKFAREVRRRVALGRGNPAVAVNAMNERWSLDFVHDSLESGRCIRTLNIVDDFTRECLAIEVDTSLSGLRVARVLDAIGWARGYPQTLVMHNGTELTGIAMACWARDRKVRLHFTAPGKPTQNAYIDSFNGRFRDECSTKTVLAVSIDGCGRSGFVSFGSHLLQLSEKR